MSKKKPITADKDFDLDFDLDMEEFNFGETEVKDDRSPVIKIATSIPEGFISGIKETEFLKGALKNILPDGFGQTIDLADKTSGSVKDAFDAATKEIKPAIKEFKRVAPKLVSKDSKFVPESVKKLLQKWQEEQTPSSSQSIEEQRDSMLSQQMAEIFQAQVEQGKNDRANEEAKDRLQQGIEISRHKDLFSVANEQAISLSKLEQYQYNTDLRFKKKSLELQYRQLFALQDTLAHLKTDAKQKEANLLAIAKNTSLPEYVKLQNTEQLSSVIKTKFAESINNGLFGDRNNFIEKLGENLTDKVKESVKGFASSVTDGLSATEMYKDQMDSLKEMPGFDQNKEMGKVAGGLIGQSAVNFFTSKDSTNISYKLKEVFKGKDYQYLEDQIKRNPNQIASELFPKLAEKNKRLFFDRSNRPLTLKQLAEGVSGNKNWLDKVSSLGSRTGNKIRDLTLNNKFSKKFNLAEKGVQLENFNETLPGRIQEFKNKNYTWEDGFKYRLLEQVQDLIPSNTIDNQLDKNSINKFVGYSSKTDKSITEIIPGFLSRIYRELQVIRTGNDKIELTKFDYESDRFSGTSKLANSLLNKIVDKRDVKYTQEKLDELSSSIIGNQEVSKETRQQLRKSLLINNTKSKLANSENILSLLDKKSIEELSPILEKFFSDMTEEDKLRFNKKYNKLSTSISDKRNYIQQGVDDGYFQELKSLGLVDSKKQIDIEKILSFYYENGSEKQSKRKQNKSIKPDLNSLKMKSILGDQKPTINSESIINNTKDVYVSGETKPRLKASLMEAGEYIDKQSGKVIRSIKDIKGDIINKHGDTILEAKEAMKLFYYDSKSKIMKKITDAKPVIENYTNQTSSFLNRAISGVQQSFTSTFNEIRDVYVKGEKEPRLTAAKLKAGLYKDKETGKTITDPKFLEGDVIDETGNVIISKEEISKLVIYQPAFKTFMPLRQMGAALKYVGGALWHYQTVIAPAWTKWNFKQLGKALKFTKDLAVGLARGRVKDVYVGNEKEPRLYAARIKNGEYFLKSNGRVITHQKEITDAIVDGEGNVLISYDDLENLRVYESVFKWINPFKLGAMAAKAIFKGTAFLAKKTLSFGYKFAKANLNMLGSVVKAGVKYLTKPVDVYVGDKPDPIILAKELKEGKYFSKKTGKPLFHHSEIDGAVVDSTGTIVLSEEDAQTGLFDITGRKLKTSFFTGVGKFLGKVNKLFSYRAKFNPVKSMPKNELDAAKQGMSKTEFISTKSLSALESIKEIINKKFNKKNKLGDSDGDGILENSYLDKMRKKKTKDVPLTGKADNKDKSNGFFGKLLMILGTAGTALAAKFGSFLKFFGSGASTMLSGFLKIGSGLIGKAATAMMSVVPALWAMVKKGAGSVTDMLGGGKGKMGRLVKGAAITGAAGYATDWAFGKFGVGKDKDGNDIEVSEEDQAKDDSNWSKMSFLEKMESGAARGIEKAGSLFFLDNLANQAKADRIKNESAYFNKKEGKSGITSEPSFFDKTKQSLSNISFDIFNNYEKEKNAVNSLRFVQYGFPSNSKEYGVKLLTLEKYLIKFVSSDGQLDEENIDLKQIMSLFGLNPSRQDHLVLFLDWYQKRFKPIYFRHLEAAKKVTGKVDISEIHKLDKVQLKQYLDLAVFQEGPYGYNRLPVTDLRLTATNHDDVYNEYTKITKDLLTVVPLPKAKIYESNLPALPKEEDMDRIDRMHKKILEKNRPPTTNYGSMVDGEHKPTMTPKVEPLPDSKPGKLITAAGELYNGRNAHAFLNVGQGTNLNDLNPQLLKQLYGMVEEYGTLTGKKLSISSGHRSSEKQAQLYAKYGASGRAAKPGHSLHEFGLALDADPKGLDELERLGLMRKYGFTRPVGAENWHVEPAGIQLDLNRFKRDPGAAEQAIASGVGRGGGGLGITPGAPKYSRNPELAKAILTANAAVLDTQRDPNVLAGIKPLEIPSSNQGNSSTPSNTTAYTPKSPRVNNNITASSGYDGESKPMSLPTGRGGYFRPTINNTNNSLPADPTVKIPNPTGVGYENVKDTILASAKMVGVNPDLMIKVAAVESGFNPNAKAKTSSASGLFQFTKAAWMDTVNKHGSKYGLSLDNASPFDAKANSLMGAHLIKDNERFLSSVIPDGVTATDIYMSHFLGPSGARAFFNALKQNPNGIASVALPNAAEANPSIFYTKEGRARTLQEIYSLMDNKLATKAREHGVQFATKTQRDPSIQTAAYTPGRNVPTPINVGDQGQRNEAVTQKTALESIPKKNAISVTRESGNSPVANGYSVRLDNNNIKPTSQTSSLNKDIMSTTENLLGESVDVQKKMLKALNDIFGIVSKNVSTNMKQEDNKKENGVNRQQPIGGPEMKPYNSPSAIVPMRRSMV
jgi:hypothetical protein